MQGRALLERFVLDIAGAKPDWMMGDYIDEAVARIREQVGDDEVILGLSGGVDSSVAAALIHGDRRPADLRLRRPRPAAPGRRPAW